MKLLSQSPEAVAVILGLSETEAANLLHGHRLAEMREKEDRQRRTARAGRANKIRSQSRLA
ncbi:MAG: hypothetical protein WDN28_18415 [Chthoniobacter sp.]